MCNTRGKTLDTFTKEDMCPEVRAEYDMMENAAKRDTFRIAALISGKMKDEVVAGKNLTGLQTIKVTAALAFVLAKYIQACPGALEENLNSAICVLVSHVTNQNLVTTVEIKTRDNTEFTLQ